MANNNLETQKSQGEKWGKGIKYVGVVAGLVGLVLNPELLIAGLGLVASGIIFEKVNKKPQLKSA
jgi:hypothetical protein